MSPGEDLAVDSVATNNMIKDRDMFVVLDENFKGLVSNAKILGKGEVRFRVKDEEGEFKMIELKDTLYVPENSRNLLSVSKMKKAGAEVVFSASSFVRQGNGSVYPLRGLFLWDTFVGKDECYVVSTLKQWHCRMGHNNYKNLSHLEQHIEGMKITDFKIENCETCELNKAKKKPVPKDFYIRATRTLDIVHTDILGPIDPIAEDGHRYAIGFVDSFSRYLKIYFMKTRDEATKKLDRFIADIGVPQTLVLDGAGEYIGQDFRRVCRKQKIRLETLAPYTPQENGKIERVWGTITPMARCMIFDAFYRKVIGLMLLIWLLISKICAFILL